MRAAELTDDSDDCNSVTLLVPDGALDLLEAICAAYGAEIVSAYSLKPQLQGYRFVISCLNPWYANDLMMAWFAVDEARAFWKECQKRKAGATNRYQ